MKRLGDGKTTVAARDADRPKAALRWLTISERRSLRLTKAGFAVGGRDHRARRQRIPAALERSTRAANPIRTSACARRSTPCPPSRRSRSARTWPGRRRRDELERAIDSRIVAQYASRKEFLCAKERKLAIRGYMVYANITVGGPQAPRGRPLHGAVLRRDEAADLELRGRGAAAAAEAHVTDGLVRPGGLPRGAAAADGRSTSRASSCARTRRRASSARCSPWPTASRSRGSSVASPRATRTAPRST